MSNYVDNAEKLVYILSKVNLYSSQMNIGDV